MTSDGDPPEINPPSDSPTSDPSEAAEKSAAAASTAVPSTGGGFKGRVKDAWFNPAYRFVFFFLLYLGLIALAYPPLRERNLHVIDAMSAGTAWVEFQTFDLFSDSVTLTDKVIVFQGFAVKIIEECTGVYEVLIFMAAVLAFPTTIVKKLIGLGMGIPLLYLFNVVRIAVLILVGRFIPEWFDFMHLYFWQATLILMITSVWLLWIIKVVKDDRPISAGAA
jgi:archaeosortase B (VPXXXP-CTERM-specific)